MTYRHCAFLGDAVAKEIEGRSVCIYKCKRLSPGRPWNICIPSYLNMGRRGDGGACPLFRIKSVVNSFDTGKEDDDGQVYT